MFINPGGCNYFPSEDMLQKMAVRKKRVFKAHSQIPVLGLPEWTPKLARRFETRGRHRIADVYKLSAREAVRDVCYLLINIDFFLFTQVDLV